MHRIRILRAIRWIRHNNRYRVSACRMHIRKRITETRRLFTTIPRLRTRSRAQSRSVTRMLDIPSNALIRRDGDKICRMIKRDIPLSLPREYTLCGVVLTPTLTGKVFPTTPRLIVQDTIEDTIDLLCAGYLVIMVISGIVKPTAPREAGA